MSTPNPPSDDARRVVLQHRRRRYPDRGACGFCGGKWGTGRTAAGTPMAGCDQRRDAIGALDRSGQIDDQGRLLPPPGEYR